MEQQDSNDLWLNIRHDLEQELNDRGYDAETINNLITTIPQQRGITSLQL